MTKEEKEKSGVIIGNNYYRFEKLYEIWHYFQSNGVPKYDPSSCRYLYRLDRPDIYGTENYRGNPEYEHIINAFDHLDLDRLSFEYFKLDAEFKKVNALLKLKDRGQPLTKEQFDSKAYDDYLKEFEEETRRLQKEAGLEEEN